MADTLHNVLAAVLKATKQPPPASASGPKPNLNNPTYCELCIWIAGRVADRVPPGDRAMFDKIFAVAKKPKLDATDEELLDGLALSKTLSPALTVAYGMGIEVLEHNINNVCGKGSRAAAVAAAEILGPGFADELSRELLRLDAVTMLALQKLDAGAPVEATLWRGTAGLKTSHWIVKLGDGKLGLIGKRSGRWAFERGARDDVLALLPESQMESAVAAVVGGQATPVRKVDGPSFKVFTPRAALAEIALSKDGKRVLGRESSSGKLVAYDVATGAELPPPASLPSPPTPKHDTAAKTVTVGKLVLKLDKPGVTDVVTARDKIFVAYDGGKRVATFDLDGKLRHKFHRKELMRGATADELHVLANGAILAFANWPRGTVMLVDEVAQVLASVDLGMYYSGVKTLFSEAANRVAFSASGAPTGKRLVVFTFPTESAKPSP